MIGTERRRRPSRRPLLPWLAPALAAVIAFAIGIAFGQALGDNRGGGETQTSIRTLAPETLPAESVTVTVTSP